MQYADYAAWQHRGSRRAPGYPERQSAADFWSEAAEASAPDVAFADAANTAGAPRWAHVSVGESVAEGLASAATRYGTSVSAVVLAAWLALLGQSTGDEVVTVSWIASERRHADLDGAIGAFARPAPVSARVAGVTFAEVLQEVQRATQRALVVQDYAPTDGTGNLDVGFISEAAVAGELAGQTRTRPALRPRLWVAAAEADAISIGFDSAYLEAAHAEQLASRLGTLLGSVAADPSAAVASLPQLNEAAREQVLSRFGEGPAVSVNARSLVHHRVAAWAAREPAPVAVVDEARQPVLRRARRAGRQAGGPVGKGRSGSR